MKQEPENISIPQDVIGRFYRKVDSGPDDDDCDYVWIDRLTNREVLRYDAADPANRPPLGPSDEDCLYRKGLDIKEEIPISRCAIAPTEHEILSYRWKLSAALERKQEEERAVELLGELDLWSYLEVAAEAFSFENYAEDEKNILLPAFERKGFTRVAFFMGEQDSFGPLSRGIRAWKNNQGFIFYYG